MDTPADKLASLLRFIDTLSSLRRQMSDEEFEALRSWIEFVADSQTTAH
jgi:hypothetical protein